MIDKQKREAEWWRQYSMTHEDRQKLIREKLERAQNYLKSQQRREAPKEVR